MRTKNNFMQHLHRPFAILLAMMICILAIPAARVSAADGVTAKLKKTATKQTITLKKGDKIQITAKDGAKTLATKNVTYKSNKKSVASVSSKGVITAKKAGTAKITVTSKKNGRKAIITVKVPKVKSTAESTLVLNASSMDIKVGSSADVYARWMPQNERVTAVWATDDDSIAQYSDGQIKAKAVGSTILTATVDGKVAAMRINVYN